jgi:putative ABC transport system permease protein
MIILKIALRNIFRHKTRSIITLSAIAFGCGALIFVGGYFDDVFYKMRESYIHGHTGHIQIYKKDFFEKGAAAPFDYLIKDPNEILAIIDKVKGVKFVTSRIDFPGLISTGEATVSFIGQGIEPANEGAVSRGKITNQRQLVRALGISGMIIESGEPLKSGDLYSITIGKGLAAGIGVKPGEGLIIVTNTVAGSINALDVILKGVFSTSFKQFDDHFIRLPLATAQKLLHTESVQSLVIMLDKTDQTQKIRRELEVLFKENNLDLEMRTWNELSDFYTKTVTLTDRFFLVLKLVISIIVILSIFNTMNMAVMERIPEIGTIMALGTKRKGVLKLFLYEGLGLGIVGGIIGIISGIVMTSLIARVGIPMPPPPGATMAWISEPKIVPGAILFAMALSITTSLISSFYPAYKASRLEIAAALRHT